MDLVDGPVHFGHNSSDTLSDQELADIKFLTSQRQFAAVHKAFAIRIKQFYRDATNLTAELALTSCWNAKALEDFLIELCSIDLAKMPEPQTETDHFDEDIQEELSMNDLPLAPDDAA